MHNSREKEREIRHVHNHVYMQIYIYHTIGANGEATTDDLAHRGDVRSDTEVCLSATIRDTEASHDLIEDKHGAVFVAQLAQTLQKLLGGSNKP